MIEIGFPEFESYVWFTLYVRAETPDAIAGKLAGTMHEVLRSDKAKAFQESRPGGSLLLRPTELAAFQRKEYERFKRVAEAAGIEPQ